MLEIVFTLHTPQLYLVAGGRDKAWELLSSAEVFSSGRWTMVGSLPAAVRGLGAATLDTGVFMAGRSCQNSVSNVLLPLL